MSSVRRVSEKVNYRLQASSICSKRTIIVITPTEYSFVLLLGEKDGRIRIYGKKTLQKGSQII